jgi:uncharacterized caspase-like protein
MHGYKRCLLATALGALALLSHAATAADKALIVGVGKHMHASSMDLPGIGLDVDMAGGIARMMGFHDVVELRDQKATLDNVRQALTSIAQATSSGDRVMIYFSGHGTQVPDENGDEPDKMDEALVMSDVRQSGNRVAGLLIDDELDQLLGRIPAKEVIVLVDACHSGTSTKAFSLSSSAIEVASSRSLGAGVTKMVEKSFKIADLPHGSNAATRSFGVAAKPEVGGGNVVSVAAAADHEYAQATSKGSLFTLGLNDALTAAKANQSGSLTLRSMHQVATRYISAHAKPAQVHTPQLTGNLALADQPLRLASTADGGGPNWQSAEEVVRQGGALKVVLNARTHREGEKLQVSVEVPSEGYLNIVSIGPDDVPVVLFPNGINKENKVSPGQLVLPTPQMKFDLVAQKPYGSSMVVAFLTREPINLYQTAEGARDSKGVLKDVIPRASMAGMRSYGVQARPESGSGGAAMLAGRVTARVCAAAGPCEAPAN